MARRTKKQSQNELEQHANQFDEAQSYFKYARDRKSRLFGLGESEKNLTVFRHALLDALTNARKNNRKLPVVIVKHVTKDYAESVNADLLLGFLEPFMYQYALLIEFTN